VVPTRRVEGLALEGVEPLDVGDGRLAQRAHAADHDVRGVRPLRGLDAPQLRVVVPAHLLDLVAEADVGQDAVVLRALAQVGEDLGLRREQPTPIGVGRERERVEVRLHVAGAARIGVVAPGPAHVGRALQDHEVIDAGLLEQDARAETRKAGPCNADVHVSRRVVLHRVLLDVPGLDALLSRRGTSWYQHGGTNTYQRQANTSPPRNFGRTGNLRQVLRVPQLGHSALANGRAGEPKSGTLPYPCPRLLPHPPAPSPRWAAYRMRQTTVPG
jgi:hypothetical protein